VVPIFKMGMPQARLVVIEWQLERRENSGTITVVGDGGPQLDIVWEHKRDGPLNVRARLAANSRLLLADAEQFFREVNSVCSAARTTALYIRGTLQYQGMPWCGEHWLDDETRLAPPSLQDQLSLQNGARIRRFFVVEGRRVGYTRDHLLRPDRRLRILAENPPGRLAPEIQPDR
jgi:hypothetical protein